VHVEAKIDRTFITGVNSNASANVEPGGSWQTSDAA
jgi:hypothetical protein